MSKLTDVSLEMNGAIVITQNCAGPSVFGALAGQKEVLIQNMCHLHSGLIFFSVFCLLSEWELWSLRP